SCFPEDAGKGGRGGTGPVVVLQGRFDAAKIQAALEKMLKELKTSLKTHAHGDGKILEVSLPGEAVFGAVLDKGHLAVAMKKDHLEALLDKASGKKKTALKSKALAEMFAKIKADQSVAVAATGDMVTSMSVRSDSTGKVEYKLYTLSETGV